MRFPDLRSNYPKAWESFDKYMRIGHIAQDSVWSHNAEAHVYQSEDMAWWLQHMGYVVAVTASSENNEYKFGYEIWHEHRLKWHDHNFSGRFKAWENAISLCFRYLERELTTKENEERD